MKDEMIKFYVSPSLLEEENLLAKLAGFTSSRPHFKGIRYTHCCDANILNQVRPEDSVLIGLGNYEDVSWPLGLGSSIGFPNPDVIWDVPLVFYIK